MAREIHLLPCSQDTLVEAGLDEAGRGPLAGPVYAAAVILPRDFHHPLLNDSKQMTEKNRDLLREVIEKEAVAWAVEAVSPEEMRYSLSLILSRPFPDRVKMSKKLSRFSLSVKYGALVRKYPAS